MPTNYQKLLSLLKELFQTDQADLDFGIYRVVNQRRDEINQFLDNDLLPQVKTAFAEYQSMDLRVLEESLNSAVKQAEELGVNPNEAPRVIEIREQIAAFGIDIEDLEIQVYSALYNFFRRYYDEGDFISQRRYKEGVYAIPYEGEEVKMYWANQDQYYIKTSEYFRDYTFKLPSGNHAHFKLVEADIEKDNRKEIDDNKRRFVLNENPLKWDNGEVVIQFEFRPDEENRNQSRCNEGALEMIYGLRSNLTEQYQKDALAELAAPTKENKERTLLEMHLVDYTRRNTQDYFIHKDLGKFLRRELDFYIKNEIMHLDDVENEASPRIEQNLSKIKVIRQIAHKIIDFLAQIEDFQKRLWLKKKFVVNTNYCITLDRIPKDLYPEIAANNAQREEWVRLFAIDEIKGDMFDSPYSEPLTKEFLKANPYLLVDSNFFSSEYKYKILSTIENLDQSLDGVLVYSENFQALNLFKEKYKSRLQGIYIDPPYNTGPSEILYKNDLKNSSWLSLIRDRLILGRELLEENHAFAIAIDDYNLVRLGELLDQLFVNFSREVVIVNHHPQGSGGMNITRTHEYMFYLVPEGKDILRGEEKEGDIEYRGFMLSGPGDNKLRTGRPNSFYALLVDVKNNTIVGIEPPPLANSKFPTDKTEDGYERWYPIGSDGKREQVWARSYESALDCLKRGDLSITENGSVKIAIDVSNKRSLLFSNWVDSKYNAGPHGTQMIRNILGESGIFSYPKSLYLVKDAIEGMIWSDETPTVIDFFAGSGTTGHAIIDLNRESSNRRKYILVEMGQYFVTALKPRIQKAIYSQDWKDGKPVSRNGISHAFKYIKLEAYEDTLNNLRLERLENQQIALDDNPKFREDYTLHYMLDFESTGSLLDIEKFENPFDYQLEIATSTVGETNSTKVDLVETFNYLLGLHVKTIRKINGVVVVKGITRNEHNIVILWRNVPDMDHDQLDDFFNNNIANELDGVTDIYVNGDNNLTNLRPKNQNWNIHLIEESFQRLMFENSGT